MAKIKRSLSSRVNANNTSEIYLRVTVTRTKQIRLHSGIYVKPERFRNGGIVMPRTNQKEINQLRKTESDLMRLESRIIDHCLTAPEDDITKETLQGIVARFHHPEDEKITQNKASFFELWDEFLKARELSENRERVYRSLGRALHRYEVHRRKTRNRKYALNIDTLTADDISDFEHFFRNEWRYYDEYPKLYVDYPAEVRAQHKTHRPQRRGDNIIVQTIKRLRTFFNWLISQELTTNRPFDRYTGNSTERYGTPYYLTIEERDRITDFDLSFRPQLAVQRDIFIFQCLIGCRVSDLQRLRKSNVIGDMVEYVPKKTKKERASTVRVPLCDRAQAIISRYADSGDERLLPCISDQRYNDAIKEVCRLCGIERMVTIINPTTGEDERKPICEVASSHMARRTFIGNLYKQVKDPNLVGSMSGHKEGSKAFARYREIDDDIKRGLIDLIK